MHISFVIIIIIIVVIVIAVVLIIKRTIYHSLFRFNKSPAKGLKFLQNESLLGTSVTEVAQFLHSDDKLDKVGGMSFVLSLFCTYLQNIFRSRRKTCLIIRRESPIMA